ncbi:MAG: DUF4340 domain-containing protein [Desulfomonile tiedjei]|nr:DUF4340 domain-containing protein [Desulfomonile tiedjei]
MKLGKVLVYLIILVAVAAYLYLVEIKHKEKQETAEKQAKKIVQLEKDKIVEIELQSQDKGKIELKKPAEMWVLTAPVRAKADEDAVNTLLNSIAGAESEKVILEKDVKWEDYGLDKSDFSVTVAADGKTTNISFGAKNPAKTSYYVRVGEDPRLFLVADTLKNALNKTTFDVRDKSVLGVAPDQVERIVITKNGAETELKRDNGGKWTMVKPEQIRVKSQTIRQDLINLTNLAARRIIDEPQKEGDAYGLDNPAEKIQLSGKNLDHTLQIGKTEDKEARPGSAPNRYVRVQGTDTVYVVDGKAVQEMKTDPQELRDRFLLTFKPLDIQKFEIELDGKKWLASQGNDKKWSLEQPEKKQLIDAWPITGMLWDLKDLEWKAMTKPLPQDLAAVHLDKPRLVVSLLRKDHKEPLVLKAGWEPVLPPKEGDRQTQPEAETKPAEKNDGSAGSPATPPASTLPPTINAIVDPHEEGSALFVIDAGIIERLKGDLEKLTEKK